MVIYLENLHFKDRFLFEAETDSYQCPKGHRLHFRGFRSCKRKDLVKYRVYCASRTVCRACAAFGVCTRDAHAGRALWIGSSDMLLRKHRQWMNTDKARNLYARRKQLNEPVFGILKEQLGARRFLLRGLENVRAEFILMATAFNLRTLAQFWTRLKQMAFYISKSQLGKVTHNIFELPLIHRTFWRTYLQPSLD